MAFRVHEDVVALIGDPVDGNPVINMYQAALDQMGLNYRFIRCRVEVNDLEAAIHGAQCLNFKKLDITVPHKIHAMQFVDSIDEAGKLVGAINKIYFENGKKIGDNTDGPGFIHGLKEKGEVKGKKVLQFGCGGAGRAIATFVAKELPESFTIVDRDQSKAEELADHVKKLFPIQAVGEEWKGTYALKNVDIMINATSIGLFPNVDTVFPLDFNTLKPGMIICDVIPNPKDTHLLQEARKRGCVTLDGQVMLINQGCISLKRLTGKDPDRAVMQTALNECLLPQKTS